MNFRRHRPVLMQKSFVLPILSLLIIVMVYRSSPGEHVKPIASPQAEHVRSRVVQWNRDLETVDNDRIFFHETGGHTDLTIRQCCAVESAAKENSDRPVHLFLQSPNFSSNLTYLIDAYPNLKVFLLNVSEYFDGTPLNEWYLKGEYEKSPFSREHFSDYIRVLSVWRGGGMYMDLDFVTLRQFDKDIFRNFVPLEYDNEPGIGSLLTGSTIHFDHGHPVLTKMLRYLASDYRPNEWTFSGPKMIHQVALKHCRKTQPRPTHPRRFCRDGSVRILPTVYFYPYSFAHWRRYFRQDVDPSQSDEDLRKTYAIHFYNKESKQSRVLVGSNQVYSRVAKVHCPITYSRVEDSF